MTFEQIFDMVNDKLTQLELQKTQATFVLQVHLTGEGGGVFFLEARDGKVFALPEEREDSDISLTLSAEDFVRLLRQQLHPLSAYMTGRIKVQGDVKRALEWMRLFE